MNKIILFLLIITFSCSKNEDKTVVVTLPAVETVAVTQVTINSARTGVKVIDFGNSTLFNLGIVISTNPNPTLINTGVFSNNIVGSNIEIDLLNLLPDTTYYIRAVASNGAGTTYGNEFSFKTSNYSLPIVVTKAVVQDQFTTCLTGGDVTSATNISGRGVCIGLSPNPVAGVPDFNNNGLAGTFNTRLLVQPATTYYIRAYAENIAGRAYGNQITITTTATAFVPSSNIVDFDGNSYPTIQINNQIWMQKNLNVTHFRNGDVIPQIQDPNAWTLATTPAWCNYENNSAYGTIYGKLYNHYAVSDPRGLAPNGWHIPSLNEATILVNYMGLNGSTFAGNSFRQTGTSTWIAPNNSATNTSGFTALSSGYRTTQNPAAIFDGKGNWATFWLSNVVDAELSNSLSFDHTYGPAPQNEERDYGRIGFRTKADGNYIRCIKD